MPELIFFHHNKIRQELLPDHDPLEVQMLIDRCTGLHKLVSVEGIYPRGSACNLPFHNSVIDALDLQMPAFDPAFGLSYDDVTDMRCLYLRAHKFDRPWIVHWSGGIDSTLILASIIKNLPRSDWQNITVACNRSSVFENPVFFEQWVRPNFGLIDSGSVIGPGRLTDRSVYMINGEPHDQICFGSMTYTLLELDRMNLDIWNHPGAMIDYVADYDFRGPRPGFAFAEWFYRKITESIRSSSLPLRTGHQMFWWFHFSWLWAGVKLRLLQFYPDSSLEIFRDSFIHWFDSPQYQQWAMHQALRDEVFLLPHFKIHAKNYIHSVDHNHYYNMYKLKTASVSYKIPHTFGQTGWSGILDDGTLLCEQGPEVLLRSLPRHIDISLAK